MRKAADVTIKQLAQRVREGNATAKEALDYARLKRALTPSGQASSESSDHFCVTTRREIAGFFGITQQAVDKWLANGMPTGGRSQYDLRAIAQWRISKLQQRSTSGPANEDAALTRARLRRVREQTAKDRQMRLVHAEKLVDADVTYADYGRLVTDFRSAMLAIPGRLTRSLEGKNEAERFALLDGEIRAALNALGPTISKSQDAHATDQA